LPGRIDVEKREADALVVAKRLVVLQRSIEERIP
jgi:hypothetical protein